LATFFKELALNTIREMLGLGVYGKVSVSTTSLLGCIHCALIFYYAEAISDETRKPKQSATTAFGLHHTGALNN